MTIGKNCRLLAARIARSFFGSTLAKAQRREDEQKEVRQVIHQRHENQDFAT
jgi:hypothetical protein